MSGRSRDPDRYTGMAGQMAVMAQLLVRQCNAAVPEVDSGTDVFAFEEDGERVARIQVKTAVESADRPGEYQFSLPLRQLERPDDPPLFYALAGRRGDAFTFYLIVSRLVMQRYRLRPIGAVDRRNAALKLAVRYADGRATCSGADLSEHLGDWAVLPPLQPTPTPYSDGVTSRGAGAAGNATPPAANAGG